MPGTCYIFLSVAILLVQCLLIHIHSFVSFMLAGIELEFIFGWFRWMSLLIFQDVRQMHLCMMITLCQFCLDALKTWGLLLTVGSWMHLQWRHLGHALKSWFGVFLAAILLVLLTPNPPNKITERMHSCVSIVHWVYATLQKDECSAFHQKVPWTFFIILTVVLKVFIRDFYAFLKI